MINQTETSINTFDVVRQVLSAILVVSGIVMFYQFLEVKLIYRVLGLFFIFGVVAYLLSKTVLGSKTNAFINASGIELRKVVWPSQNETTRTTLLVFAMVTIVSSTLWFLDAFLLWVVRLLTGQI